jgi:hypothetical protein
MNINENGVDRPMTPAEIAEHEAHCATVTQQTGTN